MPVENENFVSRWSRRKQQVLQEESQQQELADTNDPEVIIDPEVLREERLAELNALTDEDMPDVETLDENSDYSGFMSVNVSEGLRKIALKKLFQGKSFNIRDGLDEYDGDYTSFEKLDPLTITSDMKHMIDVEAKRMLAKKEEQEEAERLLAEASDVDDFDEFGDDEFEDDEEEIVAAENLAKVDEALSPENDNINTKNDNNEDVA